MEDIKKFINENRNLLFMPSVLDEKSFSIDMANGLIAFYGTGEMFLSMELWEKTREDLVYKHCDFLESIKLFNEQFETIKEKDNEYYERNIIEFDSRREYGDSIITETLELLENLIEIMDEASVKDLPNLDHIKGLFTSLSVEPMFSDVFIMKLHERLSSGKYVYLNGSRMPTFCHDIISEMNSYYLDSVFLRTEDELMNVITELRSLDYHF